MVKPVKKTIPAKKTKREKKEGPCWRNFFEVIEGTYTEKKYGPFCFGGENVQAVFISERESAPGKTARLINKLNDFFSKNDCHIFPYRKFVVILFEDTLEPTIKRLLEKLSGYLEKTGGRFAITLGSRQKENYSKHGLGIRKTCRDAEELHKKIFFYKEKKFISSDDLQKNEEDTSQQDASQRLSGEDTGKLCSYIQVIDQEKIRSFFQYLEAGFYNSPKSVQKIRQDCIVLMIEVRSVMSKKFPAMAEMLETEGETFDAIMKLPYLKDIMDTMTAACLRMSECLPLLSADSSFQRIISYVKNNYSEPLRLETLGELFNYNCAYLGKRFKDYTGKNFHAYLDMLRTDAAKELLQNTNMKVYEISSTVGYTETDYFYTKFKKHVGESPLVFRKRTAGSVD
ncbi:MAG: helix-turn-helix domain-containing protein [Treponema sp.]|jgi:two-component system response regulator YesN|nr:helix-turn-helix domain-containing protein [Treponema sp.]